MAVTVTAARMIYTTWQSSEIRRKWYAPLMQTQGSEGKPKREVQQKRDNKYIFLHKIL